MDAVWQAISGAPNAKRTKFGKLNLPKSRKIMNLCESSTITKFSFHHPPERLRVQAVVVFYLQFWAVNSVMRRSEHHSPLWLALQSNLAGFSATERSCESGASVETQKPKTLKLKVTRNMKNLDEKDKI